METLKSRFFLLILVLLPFTGRSSHIVGGEFELVHQSGYTYRLNLIIYFDRRYGNPGAQDPAADVSIYRMFDNKKMTIQTLLLDSISEVGYTQPECSNGNILTRRIFYTKLITFPPTVYNHPQGYYVSWERCCRNYVINNIVSENPDVFPAQYAGQTFYLEFPPVVKNGQPFIDSTPRLFPPLNDYACPPMPYYADFRGTDDDGDSLVYSMVAPLSTKSFNALPESTPRPYPNVTFRPPYSLNNIMNGAPDLRISDDGFLRATPTTQGLFVFAVKVVEYRNGVKIGETRRDFQMLVTDDCPAAVPPEIVGWPIDDPTDIHDQTMSVDYDLLTSDADRCIKVRVSDEDSEDEFQGWRERVRIKAVALNFNDDISSILPTTSDATLIDGSTVEFTICFPRCPLLVGGTPEIGIVAMDDACTLPLMDTLKILVNVQPPPNTLPILTSANPVLDTLNYVDSGVWPWSATDSDGDPILVSVIPNGFSLTDVGMEFATLTNGAGAASGELRWNADCSQYDYSKRNTLQVAVQIDDDDECHVPSKLVALYNLTVRLIESADPTIDSDLTSNPLERTITLSRRLTESISFNVTGSDLVDNELLVLNAAGGPINQDLPPVSIAVTPVSGTGTVATAAAWTIACSAADLTVIDQEEFIFQFVVEDNQNKCRPYKTDTLDVNVIVLPAPNEQPSLDVVNANDTETTLTGDVLTLTRGATINLQFLGTDADVVPVPDSLTIRMSSQEGNVLPPEQYTFAPVKGLGPAVQSSFVWTPDCSIFQGGEKDKEFSISFELLDNHCQSSKKDSVRITLKVSDVDGTDVNFIPPNFVSPNGDNRNDYYAMERLVPETGELENILPLDNCQSQFEYVRIYNRWGKEVFRSTDRDFKWFPDETSSGVYFYSVKYTKKEYHGSLTVRY